MESRKKITSGNHGTKADECAFSLSADWIFPQNGLTQSLLVRLTCRLLIVDFPMYSMRQSVYSVDAHIILVCLVNKWVIYPQW